MEHSGQGLLLCTIEPLVPRNCRKYCENETCFFSDQICRTKNELCINALLCDAIFKNALLHRHCGVGFFFFLIGSGHTFVLCSFYSCELKIKLVQYVSKVILFSGFCF